MFSALKFMVASVIVALFGGFLMVGVLTTQPSDDSFSAAVSPSPTIEATSEPTEADTTSVRSDILPGVELTVEKVEPGIYRVVNDGVRDLHSGRQTDIVAGHDDGIYLLRKNRFVRLGSDAGHAWPSAAPHLADFEVSPEGTVWIIQTEAGPSWGLYPQGDLLAFDGTRWSDRGSPPGAVWSVEIPTDGTVWASWSDEDDGPQVYQLGPTGWQPLVRGDELVGPLFLSAPGEFYGVVCVMGCWLQHYEDGRWQGVTGDGGQWAVGPDGTLWHLGRTDVLAQPKGEGRADVGVPGVGLARFSGAEWEWWTSTELPDMGLGLAFDYEFEVAPDGGLWASRWQHRSGQTTRPSVWEVPERPGDVRGAECDGLVRFDGVNTDHFLPDQCISMDIAADGSVWVLADEDKGRDLYVITPEAVAATE